MTAPSKVDTGNAASTSRASELDSAQINKQIDKAAATVKQVRQSLSFPGSLGLSECACVCLVDCRPGWGQTDRHDSSWCTGPAVCLEPILLVISVVFVQGDVTGGLELFMAVEKQCRLAEDMVLSQETCLAIVNTLQEGGHWQLLLEHITILTKRRGELKSTIQARSDNLPRLSCSSQSPHNSVQQVPAGAELLLERLPHVQAAMRHVLCHCVALHARLAPARC
jgi:hypothetical protein